MVARLFLLVACLLAAADALVVGGRGLSSVRQATTPLAPFTTMKSQEDKEFEEVRPEPFASLPPASSLPRSPSPYPPPPEPLLSLCFDSNPYP